MKDNFKKTIIWTNTEPPKNYLWAKGEKVYEYLGGWEECDIFDRAFIPVSRIAVNKNRLNLRVGKSTSLTALVEPNNSTDKTITWISSNPEIAEVSRSGKVSGKSEGTALIFTSLGGKFASCEVTVS